jgi:hypothetical protein
MIKQSAVTGKESELKIEDHQTDVKNHFFLRREDLVEVQTPNPLFLLLDVLDFFVVDGVGKSRFLSSWAL